MAKNKNTKLDRNGKQIKVGCKVRYNKHIWEVGYCGSSLICLYRFINHSTGEHTSCSIEYVGVNDVEVI